MLPSNATVRQALSQECAGIRELISALFPTLVFLERGIPSLSSVKSAVQLVTKFNDVLWYSGELL
jgi:hypothetical protein